MSIDKVKTVDPSIYKCVYHGYVDANYLDEVIQICNEKPPQTFQGKKISTSDVIEVVQSKIIPKGCYYIENHQYTDIEFDKSEAVEMSGMRVLMIQPNHKPIVTFLRNNYTSLRQAVSGYIECSHPFKENVAILSNEEAKLINMKGNRRIGDNIFAGTLYIVQINNDGDFCSLTDEQVAKYSEMFREPESISDDEVKNNVGFIFFGF